MRPVIVVLGCGDIGSAVAVDVFRAGTSVVVCDLPRPTHARRGMSFIDAFFDGHAALEGIEARFCPDIATVCATLKTHDAIAVASIDENELIGALHPDAIVDATLRRSVPADRRAQAQRVIGLGPGFAPGVNCHLAVETQWGTTLGNVLRDRSTAERTGGPPLLGGAGRERFVATPDAGLWRTSASIGAHIHAGDVVGTLDGTPLRAPLDGRLRGLTRDGVAVAAGEGVIEVDPREAPHIFGLGERARVVARGVCGALGLAQHED